MARIGRKRQLADDAPADDAPGDAWDDRRLHKRRRRRRALGVCLLATALAILAAPTIVGMTPLKDAVVGRALPAEAGRIACDSASFGWIAGQSLAGVKLFDPQGKLLAEADLASIDRSLWSLLGGRNSLGEIVIQRPVLHLKARDDGSNLEDFLAQLPSDPERPTPSMRIEVVDGMVRGEDLATGDLWRANGVQADVQYAAGAWRGHGAARVAMLGDASVPASTAEDSASKTDGALQIRIEPADAQANSNSSEPIGGNRFEIVADRAPLQPLRPWLERIVAGAQLEGDVSLDLEGRAGAAAGGSLRAAAVGKIQFDDARLTADQFAPDSLEMRSGWAAVDIQLGDETLTVKRLEVQGDWLEATAQGSAPASALAAGASSWLSDADATIQCKLDLAKLTRMLPRTLQLRPGVRVEAGAIEASLRNERGGAVNTWTAGLSAKHLRGSDGQREIRWDQPVELAAVVEAQPAGPQLRQASVAAPFAQGSITPDAKGYRGQLQFDLQQLADQAGQFVDLSQWRLRGSGQGTFALQSIAASRYRATGDVALQQLDVRRDGEILWNDPELRIQLDAIAQATTAQLESVTSALLDVTGPSEKLSIELLDPYEPAAEADHWFFRIDGSGPLTSWAQRLAPYLPRPPEAVAGTGSLSARIRLAPEFIQAVSVRFIANGLKVRAGELQLAEDRLELTGGCRWDKLTSRFVSKQIEFASTTVAARGSELTFEPGDQGVPTMRGEIAFRADLERLAALLGLPRDDGALLPQGQTVGQLRLSSDQQSAVAELTSTTQPLHLLRVLQIDPAQPPKEIPVWSEPRLEAAGTINYDRSADRLRIEQLQLTGGTVQISGGATVDQLSGAATLHGEVDVKTDEQAAAELVAAYLPSTVRIQGLNQAQVKVDGLLATGGGDASNASPAPHWSRRWRVDASSGWTSADVFGMSMGPGRVVAALDDGKLLVEPISIQAGDGRLTAHSRVLLDPGPVELQLASGPIVSNVRITPEVADNALKYAAPILAGTTRSEGTFSLESSGVRLPLGDPQAASARGRLTIHELSIAPGPIVQQLHQALRQIEAVINRSPGQGVAASSTNVRTITTADREVEVSVFRGRVYHRNLEFQVDGVPVRSSGSVGFDESLDVVIEFPIPEKWFSQDRLRRLFAGELVQIPIKGTFDSPRVDSEAALNRVLEIGQGAVGRAAEEIIGDELNRALDRLLRPR